MANDPQDVGNLRRELWGDRPPAELQRAPGATRVYRNEPSGPDRRRQLWRDSATILVGIVLALLAGQVFLPQNGGIAVGSPTPIPSGVEIGSGVPQLSLGPGQTFGPIIDPSIGIDRTPTPIPVITMGPTPSPSPSPSPSPKITSKPSVKPTPRPSVRPTAAPTPTAPPAPTDTPVPAPVAHFSCDPSIGMVLTCTDASTDADTWTWDWGDGTTPDTTRNASHTYAIDVISPVSVTLTVTGPGPGSDNVLHQYILIP